MYNATAYKLGADGRVVSTEAIELDEAGNVVRSCGLWSHLNGTPEFEQAWRGSFFSMVESVEIVRDGAAGYRDRLSRLAIPATYGV